MKKTASDIVLPSYKDKRFSAASGSLVMTCRLLRLLKTLSQCRS